MAEEPAAKNRVDPRSLRRTQPLNQPLPATLRWMDGLPPSVRPMSLLRKCPRIANRIAHAWGDAPKLAKLMDSLLTDERGGRKGFPGDVQAEIMILRDYAEGRYHALPTALR